MAPSAPICQAPALRRPKKSVNMSYLRTAISAIHAGLSCEDWDCVAEGYVMLEDIVERITATARRSNT
jgi:hypothetical protein